MVRAQGTLRTYPGGAAASGKSVTIKLQADNSTITSDVSDANGQWQYEANGSPGPWYWTALDAAPDPDVTRAGSSTTYGSGGPYSLYELVHALRVFGNGVIDGYLNELAVTYDGAGLDLDVDTGGAVIKGIPCIFSAVSDHAVATARDAVDPKQCYLVLEVTPAGQSAEGKCVLKDTCGAAAASPSLPSLTQSEVLFQYPLATFRLPNTGSTTLTQVSDARTFLGTRNPVVPWRQRRADASVVEPITSTTGADVSWTTGDINLTLLNGVTYDIEARAFLTCKAAAGQTISIAPYINGVGNIAEYITGNHTDFAGLANVHTLEGVVGTGGSITCGLRIKVSGGTGSYHVGYIVVLARPRS